MIKPDGRLTAELDPGEQPRDACGVFGVWSPGEEVAKLTYFGLYALQHRGQESAGIAVSDGRRIVVYKDMGLVPQVFDESVLHTLRGHIAVGHCRYSTSGSSVWENAQPTFRATPSASLALGHNGNLINTLELAALVDPAAGAGGSRATTDTDVLTALFAGATADPLGPAGGQGGTGIEESALAALPLVRGAYSLVFMDERTLYAARDPRGFRPLVLGRLARGWVVASETAALDIVGATMIREVEPGELVAIDEAGVRSRRFAPQDPRGCLFEYVYLARPDTTIAGRGVQATRVAVGRQLAAEYPVPADLVIPVPESGTPAAIGYAEASGIPYAQGLVKNSYVGRTFIQPSQTIRQLGIRLKLNPLRDVIAGQRVVVVDDSIVRGNTQRAIVAMLREAGAAEVHVETTRFRWRQRSGASTSSRAPRPAPPRPGGDQDARPELRRSWRRHRGRAASGRADARGRCPDGRARGRRRDRRVRRAVRRVQAGQLPAAAAGHLDRRRRHQGGDRAAPRPVRHRRHRPGGDGR